MSGQVPPELVPAFVSMAGTVAIVSVTVGVGLGILIARGLDSFDWWFQRFERRRDSRHKRALLKTAGAEVPRC